MIDATIQTATIMEEYHGAYAAQAAATRTSTSRAGGPGTPRPRAARRNRGGRLVDAAEDPDTGDTSGPGRRVRYRRTTARIHEHALHMLALPRQIDTLSRAATARLPCAGTSYQRAVHRERLRRYRAAQRDGVGRLPRPAPSSGRRSRTPTHPAGRSCGRAASSLADTTAHDAPDRRRRAAIRITACRAQTIKMKPSRRARSASAPAARLTSQTTRRRSNAAIADRPIATWKRVTATAKR